MGDQPLDDVRTVFLVLTDEVRKFRREGGKYGVLRELIWRFKLGLHTDDFGDVGIFFHQFVFDLGLYQ
jgi:hypothetical protein